MVQKVYYKTALKRFRDHYKKSFTKVRTKKERLGRSGTEITLLSSELKKGNGPRMYLQKKQTPQTIVLCHGLSDSPHYVSAIAKCFFDIGLNVVLPLLPAHGLKEPDAKMEDTSLDSKWKIEIDEMTEIAELLGAVVSLGGL